MKDPNFKYKATVYWGDGARTMDFWDKISIYTIEHFGMPGIRYITDISADYMSWMFKSEADALIFRLRWSEVIT